MMLKRTKKIILLMVISGCLLWLGFRPMKIISVHQMKYYSIVLVEDYPFTDKGKINWWQKNKSMLKAKYDIPQPEADGSYNVILWDFDEGYKEDDGYDRLCFDDMKPPKNCVDKNALMTVSRDKYNVTDFTLDDGVYVLQDNGLIVKRKTD
ncbi:DUF943 family protein [Erwinia sp. MYb535]|uniref:DUF943 family protein n=1 Tax=unclassified Erwinia TaxID=2622719 RepID=UPI00403F449C